jgi:hypothetical protein
MCFEIGWLSLGLADNNRERKLKHTGNGVYYDMQLIFGRGIEVSPNLITVFNAYFVFGTGCDTLVEVLVVQVDPSHLQRIV